MKKLLLLFPILLTPAFGAYNHVKPVVTPHANVTGGSDLTNYPLTFTGTYFYLATAANGGGVLSSSGYDIVFTSDSGCSSKLNFERVFWSGTNGASEFHVQIPTLSHSADTTVYLCYGNAAISTDQQSAAATWDTHYTSVFHFPNGTSLSSADSTGNVALAASGSPAALPGKLDGGAWLHNPDSSANTYLSSASTAVASAGSKTFEAWVNADRVQSVTGEYSGIVTYGKSTNVIYSLSLKNTGSGYANDPVFEVQNSSGSYQNAISGGTVYPGGWYFVVGAVDTTAGTVTVYLNGTSYSGTFTGSPAAGDGTFSLFVGRDDYSNTAPNRFFNGVIDEVRISNIARSAGWIKTEYANESSPSTFYSVGPETANSSNLTSVAVSPTNTQAIVRFNYSGDPSTCRLQVADNVSFTPVANDTNTAMFSGSDLVSRDSANLITGHSVKAVAGKRYAAQYAADGNRYSRALQQNTPYYFQVTCGSSGQDTYAGTFRTNPIAIGDTHLDGLPPDSSNPGYPAWPSPVGFARCNTTDTGCYTARRDTQYIDPQTGILLQHLVMPSDQTIDDTGVQSPLVEGNGWSITSGQFASGSLAATITASTNPIAIGAWDNLCCGTGFSNAFGDGDAFTPGSAYNVPVMLQFNIKASLGNAACTGSNNSPDCRMDVCVTHDYQTCAQNAQIYQQPLSTSATNYTFGSGQVYDVMQKPGKRIWSLSESGWRNPQVTCDGSNNVTVNWSGYTIPPDQNPAGSYIWIQPIGVQKITANTDALHFTVGSACPAGGPYNTTASAFGVLVWKETNSSDTLTLGPATINDFAGGDNDPQHESGFFGGPSLVTLGNGDPGGLVQLLQGGYSIDLLNGKVGSFMTQAPAINQSSPSQGNAFTTCQSGSGFCAWTMGNDKSLSSYQYVGDFGTPMQTAYSSGAQVLPLWKWNEENLLPTCSATITTQCFNAPTTVTQPGQTLDVLLSAFDARFNSSTFNLWFFHDIENGDLIFDIHWNGNATQSYWGWIMVFDPNATSNINGSYGAGCVGSVSNPVKGCIIAAAPGYGLGGATWLNEKELGQMLQPGWMGLEQSIYALGQSGSGPAVANKTSSLTSGSCPANPYSLTSCVTFTVDGDPYDFPAGTSSRGVLGTYQVGDQAMLGTDDITYPSPPGGPSITTNNVYLLKLVQKSGNTLTFGCVYGATKCAPTDVNPQMLWMYSTFPAFNYPWSTGPNGEGMYDMAMWDYADDPHGLNASGNTVVWDYAMGGSHGFNGNYLFSSGGSQTNLCLANNGCYTNQNFQGLSNSAFVAAMLTQSYSNVTGLTALSSSFSGHQGFNGACGNDNCQTHPDYSKMGTDPVSSTGLDGRPFVGIGNIPAVSDVSLVTGKTTLYHVANVNYLHPKIFDTMATSARRVLRNISGPGSVIQDGQAGYYTVCQALLSGECQPGSAAGDVYVNIPYLYLGTISGGTSGSECYFPPSGFAGNNSDNWSINDLCLYDSGMEAEAYTRYQLNTFDSVGATEQTFGHLFSPARMDIFSAIHPATNITSSAYNQYYYWPAQSWDNTFATMLMKAPPVNSDSGSRTSFVPVSVPIKQIGGGDHAGVEFWYAEYGGNCSPNRHDTCVAVGSSVDMNTPFYWESESYTPLSCSSSCTVTVPALPEHVLYMRRVYYSGSNVISRGPTEVIPVQ